MPTQAQDSLCICLYLLTEIKAQLHMWVHYVYAPMDSVASDGMCGRRGAPQVQMLIPYDRHCHPILEKRARFRRPLMACSWGLLLVAKGASAFQTDTLNN